MCVIGIMSRFQLESKMNRPAIMSVCCVNRRRTVFFSSEIGNKRFCTLAKAVKLSTSARLESWTIMDTHLVRPRAITDR